MSEEPTCCGTEHNVQMLVDNDLDLIAHAMNFDVIII